MNPPEEEGASGYPGRGPGKFNTVKEWRKERHGLEEIGQLFDREECAGEEE